jgi:solute carrier family 25, member 38
MPLTVIKVRYESSLYNYQSIASAAADIGRTEGLRGFFAGFGATAVRDAPYAGLYVLFYEQSKRRLSAWFGDGNDNLKRAVQDKTDLRGSNVATESGTSRMMGVSRAAVINFTSGILAGAACSAVSNPFDAVKTRIQLQPGQYRNTWHAARRMWAEEGFRSFLDGLTLRMTRKALSSALAWTVYEELVRRAEVRWMKTA